MSDNFSQSSQWIVIGVMIVGCLALYSWGSKIESITKPTSQGCRSITTDSRSGFIYTIIRFGHYGAGRFNPPTCSYHYNVELFQMMRWQTSAKFQHHHSTIQDVGILLNACSKFRAIIKEFAENANSLGAGLCGNGCFCKPKQFTTTQIALPFNRSPKGILSNPNRFLYSKFCGKCAIHCKCGAGGAEQAFSCPKASI